MQSDQRFPVSFSFFLYKTKNPEIAENSPKDKEKMLSLVKIHDSKMTRGCCRDSDHVGNRKRPDFYVKMREQLVSCSNNIKDYLFTSGQRNGRVMDPAKSIRGLAAAEIWGEDPIHPREEIYDLLAEGIRQVEKSCGSGSSKRKRPEAPPGDHSVSSRSSGPPSGGEGGSYSNNNFNQSSLLAGDRGYRGTS